MTSLENKTAVITGGAMGIGLATAIRLVRERCAVTIWDINEEALQSATAKLKAMGGTVFAHACDVTDRSAVRLMATVARTEMGKIDFLINNAGYVRGGDLVDQSDSTVDSTIAVNLTAVIDVTRAVLPDMETRNSGHIVNISSAAGLVGVAGLSTYCAVKWGVYGFTEAMRMESIQRGKSGIRWSSIHPSYLAEGMFAGAKLGFLGNLILPLIESHDVVAKAIVERALKRRALAPKRPYMLHLTPRLRGVLPDVWFQTFVRLLGVSGSMSTWKGRG
jgi:all-trans-retinol dehydrogenase (NAD+)